MDKETNDRLLDAIELLNRTVAAQLEVMERTQDGGAVSIAARDVEFKYEAGEVNLDEIFRATALEALSEACPEGDFKDEIITHHVRAQICMLKRDVFAFSREVALCLETIANKVFSRGNRKRLNTRSKALSNKGVTGRTFDWDEKEGYYTVIRKYQSEIDGSTKVRKNKLQHFASKLRELEALFNPFRYQEFGIIESIEEALDDGKRKNILYLKNSKYRRVIVDYDESLEVNQSILYYANNQPWDKENKSFSTILKTKKVTIIRDDELEFTNFRLFQLPDGDVGNLNWIIPTLRNYESHGSFKSKKYDRLLIQNVKAGTFDKSRYFYESMNYLNEFLKSDDLFDFVN